MLRNSLVVVSVLAVVACGPTGPSAEELNTKLPAGGGSGTTGGSAGSNAVTGGAAGSGVSGGSGGSAGTSVVQGGVGGMATGGSDGAGTSAGGSGGSGGEAPSGPYAPRTGSFKMLVLSRTAGYRHADSIETGKTMLQEIATAQGFELAYADSDAEIDAVFTTAENLAQFEVMYHMNTTGDMLDDAQQAVYEQWMTNNGAFVGNHSATDTENGWAFYSEVTGQYYNGHGAANTPDQIQFEPANMNFIALKGLPNPWQRNEEWYKFDNHQVWSAKPGFQILGRKAADGQPIMWTREWGNFRAFYNAIGHDGVVFQDPDVKKHFTAGIMWAVRRDHLIK